MTADVTDLRAFYASPLGVLAQRTVGRTLAAFWPNLAGLSLLGMGYATPYLWGVGASAERILAFMPAAQGVVAWPSPGRSASALVEPDTLPLADGSVDRVLVVHALESVESPGELLAEAWRVLTPGGRLVLVVPNRRGLWARIDRTPFGQGQPFSRSQLRILLRRSWFSPEHWAEILYLPPFRGRAWLGAASMFERVGLGLSLPFGGLHAVEATKQLHRPIAARERKRQPLRVPPLLRPVPTSREPF